MQRVLRLVCLAPFVLASAEGADWPQWRGPSANGTAPAGSYPTQWSPTANIDWQSKLPGPGASTPVVWGDRILLTCAVDGKNAVLCLNRQGREQWRLVLGEERPGKHKKATGSNPSCVTGGERVFAYFKSGELVAATLAGKQLWRRNLQQEFGEDTLWWDLGSSPVLTGSHVVVTCVQSGPSYLAAFEQETGKLVWKQDRNLNAPEEAAQTYSTPIVSSAEGEERIYVLGADHVTAHRAANGEEVWRVGGLNPGGERFFRSIASPVIVDGILIAPYARGRTLTAIRLGGQGDVTSSHVVWKLEDLGADVPTPAAAAGKVYLCTDRGQVACLEAGTGKTLWQGDLERSRFNFSASPILAGGHLYLTREDGSTFVLRDGPQFELVSRNELPDAGMTVATPVFVDGHILLRTVDHLYCIRS